MTERRQQHSDRVSNKERQDSGNRRPCLEHPLEQLGPARISQNYILIDGIDPFSFIYFNKYG